MEWKHGVLPVTSKAAAAAAEAAKAAAAKAGDGVPAPPLGRVSIIAWGWVDQDVSQSRIRTTDP